VREGFSLSGALRGLEEAAARLYTEDAENG
jgi:hypothetical protein